VTAREFHDETLPQDGAKTKIELVFPAELKAGLGYRVVAILRARVNSLIAPGPRGFRS